MKKVPGSGVVPTLPIKTEFVMLSDTVPAPVGGPIDVSKYVPETEYSYIPRFAPGRNSLPENVPDTEPVLALNTKLVMGAFK
jgi:hypothetical protein